MSYLGDLAEDATLYTKFTTRQVTGTPDTLAGTPIASVYKNDETNSETTTGVTLIPDFDTLTGANHLTIDTSADAFYSAGADYQVLLTAGTVNAVSIVGEVVAEFSIQNRLAGTQSIANGEAIGNIGTTSSGGGLSFKMDADNTLATIKGVAFVGAVGGGTLGELGAEDASYYQFTDTAGGIDIVFQADIGPARLATEFVLKGFHNSGNDDIPVQLYDFEGAQFVSAGILPGKASTVEDVTNNDTLTLTCFSENTGTAGGDAGLAIIRFVQVGGTSPVFNVDQLTVSTQGNNVSVGYVENAAVTIDTVNGEAGTTPDFHGTADRPSLTLADALTIAAAKGSGLSRFNVIAGSTITFVEAHLSEVWTGVGWTLVLNAQDVSGINVSGAAVSGTCTGAILPIWTNCEIQTTTLPPSTFNVCGFETTMTAGSAGTFDFLGCFSRAPGASVPVFDLGPGIGGTSYNMKRWSGGATFNNVDAGDDIVVEGVGGTLTLNGTTAGTNVFKVRGTFVEAIDNTSGGGNPIDYRAINNRQASAYRDGMVFIEAGGLSTDDVFESGTELHPVSTFALAQSVAAKVTPPLNAFNVGPVTTLTLTGPLTGTEFTGRGSINMNGQALTGTRFVSIVIIGDATFTGITLFLGCLFTGNTLDPCDVANGAIDGDITFGNPGAFRFESTALVKGTPVSFDFALGNLTLSTLQFTNLKGSILIENMGQDGTADAVIITGQGSITLAASCIGGTVQYAGDFDFIDNSSGITLNDVGSSGNLKAVLATNLAETSSGRIANNFDFFYDNADAQTTRVVDDVGGGGTPLTSQQVRDALKLTPTAGAPAVDSVDEHLDDLLIATETDIPASLTIINDAIAVLPEGIIRNQAFANFPFEMVLASDHVTPATGLTVTGQRSLDGGAYVPVTGTISEVGQGSYSFDASAADTNGDVVDWRFSAATADDTKVGLQTSS